MKVLQINAVYGRGSTGTIVRDIERLCFQNGIDCFVASPDKAVSKSRNGYIIGNVMDHKLHALLCRIHGKQAYFSRLATRRFLRYVDGIKPDVVHLHNLHSNFINLNLLLSYLAEHDIRTIVTLHDCWFFTGGCFHYTAAGCDKWLSDCRNCPKKDADTPSVFSKRSARILADRKKYFSAIPRLVVTGVSDWMTGEGRKTFFGKRECLTIRNGIDLNVFKPTPSDFRKRLGLEDKFIILGPASKWLLPVNRPVLDYFAANMKSDEVLFLFGACQGGADGLPGNVCLYGYSTDREELAALYSMADVFANVSREDSLSLINVEAQACGTPVVTFDQTGLRETVNGVNGFCVKAGNARELYRAVQRLRELSVDKDAVREFVSEKYESGKTYKSYRDIYEKTII